MNNLDNKYVAISELMRRTKDRFINLACPLNTNDFYDVIAVQKDGTCLFVKILCNKQWRNHRSGSVLMDLPRYRKHKDGEKKKYNFDNKTCDMIFACILEDCYLIPSYEITQKNALTIHKFEKYKI